MIEIIKRLAEINFENRKRFNENLMRPIQYAIDHKTIHIDAGRASGKTTAIKHIARPNDLIITFNYGNAMLIKREARCDVETVSRFDIRYTPYYPKEKYSWVFFDDPYLCYNKLTETGYRYFQELVDADLYVMVGR